MQLLLGGASQGQDRGGAARQVYGRYLDSNDSRRMPGTKRQVGPGGCFCSLAARNCFYLASGGSGNARHSTVYVCVSGVLQVGLAM